MDAQQCNDLAWSCLRAGQTDLALEHARRAHELKRGNLDYLNTLGVAYGETGQLELAEATFRKVLKRRPTFIDALVNLAKALEKQERFAEARLLFERAFAIEPRFPRLATNLAKVCRDLGEVTRARELLEKAAGTIDPQDLAMALAGCEVELGEPRRGLERLARATAEHADWIYAQSAYAHLLLATGGWREGWRHYLARRRVIDPQAPAEAAVVLPARLDGRRILLRGDQGIGDVLFFLRFAPLAHERGAVLTLACEKKLLPVLGAHAALQESREQRAGDDGDPRADRRIWIGDLPGLLEAEVTPPAWPVSVEAEELRRATERLAALGPPPYLGITWRAGTDTARGREFGEERKSLTKAVPPRLLGAALRGWHGTAILLQRGARATDAAEFAAGFGAPFHDLTALTDDLRALLAVLAVLDEYATVSNTNVHLLAGLGRRARVLVPCPAEWRWMREEGRSPWFPAFPVYRQPASRDWTQPLAALRADLDV
jgi:tetratricopeptide (TPR) repeat protein